MQFRIVTDSNVESGLSEVTDSLFEDGFREYFADRQYNDSGLQVGLVLMCRDPGLRFKQRIRLSKRDNYLYVDIMLDFPTMERADPQTRKKIVAEKLLTEMPPIIAKYKALDFDVLRFTTDLREWFECNGWIGAMFPD